MDDNLSQGSNDEETKNEGDFRPTIPQVHSKDVDLRTEPCHGYLKLCSVFEKNIAIGSGGRSSNQLPNAYDGPPLSFNMEETNDTADDYESLNDDTQVQSKSGSMMLSLSKHSKSHKQQEAFSRLCESMEATNRSINSKLNDKQKEKQCIRVLDVLRELPDVSTKLLARAAKYIGEKEDRRIIFLAMTPVEQRAYLDEI